MLWGTLIAGAIAWGFVSGGWPGLQQVLHPHGWEGWCNVLLAPFALFVWGIVFVFLALGSGLTRTRPRLPGESPAATRGGRGD